MIINKNLIIGAGVAILLIVAGYWSGSSMGYKAGYNKAIADAANPFKVVNPLEGVEANPFEETAKKLNPFAK